VRSLRTKAVAGRRRHPAIAAALDAARLERGRTWVQVAQEIGGVNRASLTNLRKGGRAAFPHVMRIVGWLDRPAADFVRASAI
jgi:hypothetical protein